MSALAKTLVDGKQWLVRLDEHVQVETSAGTERAQVKGELVLRVHGTHPFRLGASAVRFGLTGTSVQGSAGETGRFSIIGEQGKGMFEVCDDAVRLQLQIASKLNYPSLDRARVPDMDKGCYYQPAFEPASVRVTGRLVLEHGQPALRDVRVAFVCAAGEFDQLRHFTIERDLVPVTPLLPSRGSLAGALRDRSANHGGPCNSSLDVNERRVVIQPVGFSSSASDPAPSGSTAAAQFAMAQSVWSKSCIELDVRPIVIIENAALKTSSNLTDIRAGYDDSDPDVIEVFFVDNLLPATGGGNAGGIGVASCKVVIAEPNAGNPVLLAHELGHVLGLLHPPGSDSGSVMQPTGSASNPGTELVTHFMCEQIANPVLETLSSTCCLSHDTGDHYIRDFPVDIGDEPSEPLPAGMTRYSMSNVYNRLSDTPGGWNASTGPDHEQPARFEADGTTPKINWMHARVEQLADLEVREAKVRFYMKQPGAGGGGAGLSFVGEVDVPSALEVGNEQIVRVPWLVPSGTPNHSCVFGVVHSPAEPLGDPTSLSWHEFEQVAYEHNDWAQRNLNVVDVDPGGSNLDGNQVASAPCVIQIPADRDYERLPYFLEVDARNARGLRSLALEIPGQEHLEVTPGERVRLEPKTPLVPGEELPVVLRAVMPADAAFGTRFSVQVDPVVAKRPLAGFAAEFRLRSARAAVAQTLDWMMGAFVDLAAATDEPFAHELLRAGERAMAERPRTARELADLAGELTHRIEQGIGALAHSPGLALYDITSTVQRLARDSARYRDGLSPAQRVNEGFRDLVQRLSMSAAYLLARPAAHDKGSVRVVLDRLEIAYDHDLLGPGECYFTSEVRDGHGRVERRRLPECGTYCIDAGCRTATVQLDETLYEGTPGDSLTITLDGCELDLLSADDRFTRYERTLQGDAASFVGRYTPKRDQPSAEGMPDWRIFYRIV